MTSSVPPTPPVPPYADPHVVVRLYGATDVGHTREHNEDTFLVADLETGTVVAFDHGSERRTEGPHGLLFVVADGMGGAAAGEIASAMAAHVVYDELRTHWRAEPSPSPEGFATALRDATETANAHIHAFARQHPEHRGMGTTVTAVGLLDDRVYIAQVGDSRAYLVRDGALILLTRDQSLIQRLVDAGELSEEQAEQSDRRNIILQALGPEPIITVDLTHQQIRLGDTLIVCSDGLSGVVKTPDIEEAARAEQDPAVLAHRLIARANELGGPDNITVVVAHFEGTGLRRADGGDSIGRTAYPLAGTLAYEDGATLHDDPAVREPTTNARGAPRTAAYAEHPEYVLGGRTPATQRVQDRRARAIPVLVLLVLLGLAAAGWLLYKLFTPATA